MKIDIISDTICPWCFIGKRRLARALELRPQDRLEVFWHPFQLNPDMPQEGIDRGRYLADKFGGPDRAERVYDRIRAAGREEGIEFRFDLIKRTPNTVDSHRLVAYAGMHGVQDPVVEAAGLDGGDVADFLAAGTDRDRIVAEDERVRTMGVSGVPCFIIDQRYAVSGAQSPEVFFQIFDLVREEQSAAAVPSAG
jgi:predicted DsbA family dithiol-disulfide isomerase